MLKDNVIGQAQFIVQNIPFGILIEDSERKIYSANQEFINIFNIPLTTEELVGVDCGELAEQTKGLYKDPNYFLEFLDNCLFHKKQSELVEFELINGKFISVSYIPYFQEDIFCGHSWCFSDISEQKKYYQLNIDQKNFYETILNQLPADIAIFDQNHNYLFLNKQAIKDDNLRKWLIGKDDYDYCNYRHLDSKIADRRRNMFNKLKNERVNVKWEDTSIDKNGIENTVLRIFHPFFEENDTLKYAIGYGIDLTAFKLQDLMLKEEEQKSLELIKELREVIFNLDNNGIILSLNPAWFTLTGLNVEKSLNQNITLFLDNHDGQVQELKDFFNDVTKREIKYTTKIRIKKLYKWIEISIFKKTGLVKNSNYIWGTIIDIDEKIKTQEQLLEIVKKEKELNELKSGFVNMVSHEVRTPLAGILSSVELLEIYNQDANQIQKSAIHYQRIKEQILKISDLMSNVLLLGKLESGKLELQLKEEDFIAQFERFINNNYENKIADIIVEGEPFNIVLDWKMICHVFCNLIDNAIKYTVDTRLPVIKIRFIKNEIEIIIKDFGIGIPKKDISKLFIPFNRASNVGNIEGTGLGLMLAKNFIGLHKGNIKLKSELNRGTIFTINLPVNK